MKTAIGDSRESAAHIADLRKQLNELKTAIDGIRKLVKEHNESRDYSYGNYVDRISALVYNVQRDVSALQSRVNSLDYMVPDQRR